MRTFTLYACSPGDRIDVILPRIIEGVKATGETVYFTFNGKTAEVTENSNLKEIWGEFKRIDLLEAEANLMRGVRNLVHQWDAFNEQPIPDISNLPGKLLSPDEATEQQKPSEWKPATALIHTVRRLASGHLYALLEVPDCPKEWDYKQPVQCFQVSKKEE